MQYLEIAIRCLVGSIFFISSISKTARRAAFSAFVESVRGITLLRSSPARLVALCVVVAEFAVWVLLAVPAPSATVAGLSLAALLLAAFAAAIVSVVRRGADAACRCFGASTVSLGPRHIARNVVLSAAATLGAAAALTTSPVDTGMATIAGLGGLLMGSVVAVLDDVIELFQPTGKATGARVPGYRTER